MFLGDIVKETSGVKWLRADTLQKRSFQCFTLDTDGRNKLDNLKLS